MQLSRRFRQDSVGDNADNCPAQQPDQLNTDGDAEGDACDSDDDNDGFSDDKKSWMAQTH